MFDAIVVGLLVTTTTRRLLSAIDAAQYVRGVRASSLFVSFVTSGNGVHVVASVSIP